jgi:hypothetical protein
MAAGNKPARFLKTRENTSGNLKQRGPKSRTVGIVLYDESAQRTV